MPEITITRDTVLYGLIGYPLGHSFSPPMHNAAFAAAGLNKAYVFLETKPENLGAAVTGLKALPFGGGNVTIPHKVAVMQYLDEVTEAARLIGAVNVIKIVEGRAIGYNTDGSGFFRSFNAETGSTPEGKVFFINGAGGASRAITVEAVLRGAKKVYICNRTFEKAEALAADINAKIRPCAQALHLDRAEMAAAMADVDVVINTTNIGMHPNLDDLSLDTTLLRPSIMVCDAIYNPAQTRLLKEAAALGCQTLSGVDMLINQGAESQQLWNEQEPPLAVMSEVIRGFLNK